MVKNNSSSSLQEPDHGYINGGRRSSRNGKGPQYKGVRMRSWGSWVSEIRAPNQKTRIWLGSYSTPEAAARAYDAALLCLKGNSARLNFPADPPLLSLPLPDAAANAAAAMSPKFVQRVAAAAAAGAALPISTLQTPSSSFSSSSSSPDSSSDDEASMISPKEVEKVNDFLIDPSTNFEAFFQSPKCMDYMLSASSAASAFFAPYQAEDWGEEFDDIELWSFC